MVDRQTKRHRLALAKLATCVAVLGLTLGACGGTSSPSSSASSTLVGSGGSAGGGSLTFTRLAANTPTFGPVSQNTGNDAITSTMLFSNLVKVGPDDEKPIPDLATSWTSSHGAKVYTFKLRAGVKWSDGQPFTAKDVVFTITQAAQFGPEPYIGYQPTEWRDVAGADQIAGTTKPLAGVKAIDDTTVQITLAQPNANYVRNLTDAVYAILPEHVLKDTTAKTIKTVPFTRTAPVGTGPYTLEKYVPNQYLEFKANPSYFGGAPKIGTMFFKLNVQPETAVAQMQSGELQLVLDFNPADAPQLQRISGVKSAFVVSPAYQGMEFRVDNAQVKDARVRQAMYYAIDRRALLKNVFGGHGQLLSTVPGFDQNDPALNQYPYDPAKAKQLLQEAGYDAKTPLKLLYSPDFDANWKQIAPVVQKYLSDVGMNVVLEPLDSAGWIAKIDGKDPNGWAVSLASGGSMGLSPDRSSIYFNCKAPLETSYANCALDGIYKAAAGMTDPQKQAAEYAKAAKILNTDLPYAGFFDSANLDAYTTKLGGTFNIYPNDRDTFFQVAGWTLAK
jgi:peptide/nickel transport system substrate-binding protein